VGYQPSWEKGSRLDTSGDRSQRPNPNTKPTSATRCSRPGHADHLFVQCESFKGCYVCGGRHFSYECSKRFKRDEHSEGPQDQSNGF
jgi:hypothetical protein